ncbi:hypothetical protein GPECTOR_21g712 [Gonium pectorale]|uniref:Helicase ATP-binding domain-containing protein n=1 Tax=Gonium pectorale TaxID=33097 RepID=A0A150GI18_GONPE|nr:hypothetical protein GPECTOR_21g712 [Gonium pectorale]|eukprot:KXZ49486.1 hypothetical protein GPECTOR_21g712 [Gonium pectorale]
MMRRPWIAGGPPALARPVAGAAGAAAVTTSEAEVDPAVLRIADGLPIRECLAEVLMGLDRSSGLVLQAPPGAGKTTVVPLALLAHRPEYLRAGERILVLEPRRVAAKGAARRMASSLGEAVGRTVGYRVRLDSKRAAHLIRTVLPTLYTSFLPSPRVEAF